MWSKGKNVSVGSHETYSAETQLNIKPKERVNKSEAKTSGQAPLFDVSAFVRYAQRSAVHSVSRD